MKHAVLSPSSAHRWLVCPGSIEANADKPWTQSVYALEGTSAHGLLEVCLRLDADPERYLGKILEPGHMPVDEGMVDAVGHAVDYVKQVVANTKGAVVHVEKPVYPGPLLNIRSSLLWGTPDIQIHTPKELITIDYKHGVGKAVAVRDNVQIKLYHAGGRVAGGRYPRYRSVVVQPRLPGRRAVQEHSITDTQLMQWLDKTVAPVVPVALGKNAPRVAGDHCHYCHASGKCPAQLEGKLAKAAADFKANPPKGVALRELPKYLDLLPTLKIAIKDLEEHAVGLVHAGREIKGYEKAWNPTRRLWVDEAKAEALLKKLGLKQTRKSELLSPREAEDALKAKGVKMPKSQPSPLEPVVGYTEASPTIRKKRVA